MRRPSQSTIFVLKAFVPYTKANLLLSFSPSRFFYELGKISKHKQATLRSSYYRSLNKGFIGRTRHGHLYLTRRGRKLIQAYKPKKLENNLRLIVAFDIPEKLQNKRRSLRLTLKELKFVQLQRSLWISVYDHADYIKQECEELNIEAYVRIFEAKNI